MSHDPTFFHQHEPESIHTRHRRRLFWRWFKRVVLVLLGAWVALLLLSIGQLVSAGLDLRQAVEGAGQEAKALDFAGAKQQMAEADRSLASLERSFSLLRRLWIFPGLNEAFINLQGVFASSRQLVDSFTTVFDLSQDILQLAGAGRTNLASASGILSSSVTFKDLPRGTKHAILERLSTASDDFTLLSSRLQIATDELNLVRSNPLAAPLLGSLSPLLAQIADMENQLGTASVIASVLPELSGLNGDRTHLVLFLNADELRPGGGFIGTYGLLHVRDGEVVSLVTKDSYALDRLVTDRVKTVPPNALSRYNATPLWFFRDANWSPDFSVSAEQTARLFEAESALIKDHPEVPTSTHLDSVIGFTPALASALLERLGPIQIGAQTFTAQNVPDLIEYEVEQGYAKNGIAQGARKEILGVLVEQIQDRLTALPASEWGSIFQIISQAVAHKQLAMYSRNPAVQKGLSHAGWAGILSAQTPDVQMFVDANLASLKTDPVVDRAVRYEGHRNESGDWVGRTTITYTHRGGFDWRTTRYRTALRLFVPAGTDLIQAIGLQDGALTSDDLGLRVFSGFVVVEPKTTATVVFEYRLAPSVVEAIAQEQYALTYFKQMGARNDALTLDLDFDKNITHAVPPENSDEWGDDRYRLNTKLDQDLTFDVGL
ncbi:DUF4012 domain-containing protein [Candidatus Uhrbacteria bacterium]|nr:DUF4012 domain-containing protein [Candidatus Uhrbacteria bacterium]